MRAIQKRVFAAADLLELHSLMLWLANIAAKAEFASKEHAAGHCLL
jgi:hypothetical protein